MECDTGSGTGVDGNYGSQDKPKIVCLEKEMSCISNQERVS